MGHRLPCCVITEHPAEKRGSVEACAVHLISNKKKMAFFKVFCRGVSRRMHLWDGGFLEILLYPSVMCIVLHLLQHGRDHGVAYSSPISSVVSVC